MTFLPVDPKNVLTGGLTADARSRASGGILEVLNASPFNVGSGTQTASASPAGTLPSQIGNNIPLILIVGGAVWAAAILAK